MSASHITDVCIKYHMSSAAEGGGWKMEHWCKWPKEQIHLKADPDTGEVEGVSVLRVQSEGLM